MNHQRIKAFRSWWKKNHSNKKGHHWLIKHSKRCCHNYHIAPEQFDHAKTVWKRYNHSEYKKLSNQDAAFLWRLTHPTMNERRERLLASAAFFAEIADHKQLSK